jgi:ABC-2 type transport system permease protein
MNIYLHELKALRKTTLIWACAMIAVAALYLSMFPGIIKDAQSYRDLLGAYPPQVLAMMGVMLDSITSLTGFYSMVMTFVVLCGALMALNFGVSVLSKESREKTADFLLVKPVSRTAIVNAKILAAFTMFLLTDLVYYAFVSALASAVKQTAFSAGTFFLMNLTLLFLQLIFFSLGLCISVFLNKIRSVLPISLGTVFAFYFIGALLVKGSDDGSRYVTPFKYFDYAYINKHGAYETSYLVTGAVLVAVTTAVSYFVYTRKDIHAV